MGEVPVLIKRTDMEVKKFNTSSIMNQNNNILKIIINKRIKEKV